MAVIGVIFIVLAAILGGAAFWVATSAGAAPTTVQLFNNQLSLTPLTMFLAGAATMLLLVLGLWIMTAAGKRKARASKQRRELEKQAREQERELAKTRAKLAEGEPKPTTTAPVAPPRAEAAPRAGQTTGIAPAAADQATGPRPDGTYGETPKA